MPEIVYHRRAEKHLAGLSAQDLGRIVAKIEEMAAGGPADVRPIVGQPGCFRLRVGNWRVIFHREGDPERIVITWIGPRGDAYRAGTT